MRVAAVAILGAAAAVSIGVISLFPAFSTAYFSNQSARGAIARDTTNASADTAIRAARLELEADSRTLSAIVASATHLPSDIVRRVSASSRGVYITDMSISSAGKGITSVSLHGSAPTREALLALKAGLERLFTDTRVDVPISMLAKSSNIDFTLRFEVKTP